MTVKKKSSREKKLNDSTSNSDKSSQKSNTFPVVAIGASAGGLEAFEKFFTHLSKNTGMAYVVITHLDRDHISILPELIRKYTSLSVVAIKSGMTIKRDTVYIIPPKKNITIQHGILNLVEQAEPHYKNLPVSFFFDSLAKDKGENAIAIILSGSGSDGALGLQKIKEYGGLSIAQDPLTAGFDSMPRNAINTGLVDYVMEAEAIPQQLTKFVNYGKITEGKISPELQQILVLLRVHTGHDFSNYKLNTVCRRVEKQMYGHSIETLSDYVRFLRANPYEIDNLFKDLLIGVTRFFRDADAFDVLKYKVLPLLLKDKPKNYVIRVWVPACSTGEEAYSIAIVLRECMDEMKKYFNVQIFATDIDSTALEIARGGFYPEAISVDVSTERLKRFFIKDSNQYKIKKDIRNTVIFGAQNIVKDPPFTRLDLICCRNLLIYFTAHLQKKILPLFHYSLKPKGILFLGTSEATTGFTDYFQLIAKKWKIFERKSDVSMPHPLMGFDEMPRIYDGSALPIMEQKIIEKKAEFNQSIQTFILDHYMSPYMVINTKGDIIYSHANARYYLHVSKKKNNLNISEHTYREIKMILIPGIRRIELIKKEIVYKNLKIKIGNKKSIINLHMIPITHVKSMRDLILVIFKDADTDKPTESKQNKSSLKKTNIILEEVVQELQYTKENLQATIEELEAGNEELQSANEELQSTNEEIETSKEELQALNEELIIVNTELQNTIDKLTSVNDDINNLFNSTEIAAFFLDNDLKIKRFTPKAQEFIHLIQADIGRPFSHFSSTIKCENLVENAEEVLKTLHQKNYEVESKDNRWYHVRILPYRTLSNMIDGVVITLAEVTKFKEYENKLTRLNHALQDSLTYSEGIINTLREPLLVLNKDMEIISANRSFCKIYKLKESEITGKFLYEIDNKQWDIPELRKLLTKIILDKSFFENYQLNHTFHDGAHKKFLLNARIIHQQKSGEDLIFLVMEYQQCEKTSSMN